MYEFKYKIPFASFEWLLPYSKSNRQKICESVLSAHMDFVNYWD